MLLEDAYKFTKEVSIEDINMKTLDLKYSRKEVQRAGENLIDDEISVSDPDLYSKSMQILSDWRSLHAAPLDEIYEKLTKAAVNTDRKAITAKRLKRIPSIVKKLRRFKDMKLRNMQDIGGCRAILETEKQVIKLQRELNRSKDFRIKDYIKTPKEDGYRGIHLIGKITSAKDEPFFIEVQLRTRVQHAWATSVEIVDLFTNQALKSNQGTPEWKEFFRLSSEILDTLQKSNGQEKIDQKMLHRLFSLYHHLDAHKKFEAFSSSLRIIDEELKHEPNDFHLLLIDTKNKTVEITSFLESQFTDASSYYLELEKISVKEKDKVVALVSTNSIKNLKEAYPNYFGDSNLFVKNIEASFNHVKRQVDLRQLSLDLSNIRQTSSLFTIPDRDSL